MKQQTNWTVVGAVGAAVAASACCTIPLLLVSVGIGGAWVSTLTSLEPYRPIFVALALGLLALAFYRSHRAAKAIDCECDAKPNPTAKLALMLFGAAVTVALIASPLFFSSPSDHTTVRDTLIVSEKNVSVAVLSVDKMTCAGCTGTVSKALTKLHGVIEAQVTYEPPQAIVKFDRSLLSTDELTQATRNAGYPSTVALNDIVK